jgi:D-alanine--poly(phosphoribitol) ligase subunit 1
MTSARQANEDHLGSLNLVIFCGEPLFRQHIVIARRACPNATFINTYGPTEGTVTNSWLVIDPENLNDFCDGPAVSIGEAIPIPGQALHLVEDGFVQIGPETHGEIVITGPQVTPGYFRDEKRTNESYRKVVLSDGTATRGYYTGDWARRKNKRLFFSERRDQQVKILGYRIELGEIETAIMAEGLSVCCALVVNDKLVAVVQGGSFSESDLRRNLRYRLEGFKVPSRIMVIPKMPLNQNGKIDRRAVLEWSQRNVR